jgi:hypothetical protein
MIERMLNYNKEICLVPYPIKGQDTEKVRNRILAGSKLDPLLLGNQYTMSVEDPRNVKVDNGFIEVIRGPAGCMLIKREVIEKLIKEYPDYTIKQHTLIDGKLVKRKFMYNFFDTYWNPDDKTYTGEDFWFCKLCRDIGVRIYALVDEYISHHGEYSYTGRLVDEFMKLDSNSSVQIEAKTINSEVSTNSSDIATKA